MGDTLVGRFSVQELWSSLAGAWPTGHGARAICPTMADGNVLRFHGTGDTFADLLFPEVGGSHAREVLKARSAPPTQTEYGSSRGEL